MERGILQYTSYDLSRVFQREFGSYSFMIIIIIHL